MPPSPVVMFLIGWKEKQAAAVPFREQAPIGRPL
jgi:hypothetical protein